jgi:hypothetical protein
MNTTPNTEYNPYPPTINPDGSLTMNQTLKEKWIQTLESNTYQQGQGFLCYRKSNIPQSKLKDIQEDTLYCCLGVLCEIVKNDLQLTKTPAADPLHSNYIYTINANKQSSKEFDQFLPASMEQLLGISSSCQTHFADLNDEGLSFKEIAKVIKETNINYSKKIK